MSAARYDLAIVGGGPAGLAAAAAGSRRGLRCVVLDGGEPGRDKACGEGILPDGLAALARCGVDLGGHGRHFRGIRFHDREHSFAAEFPGPGGLAVRRTALHAALAEAAAGAGAELRWRTRVAGLAPAGVETAQGAVQARFVVGADGLHSRVRRWLRLDGPPGRPRFGVRRHYAVAPWSELVEVGWSEGCESYLTPVGEREIGVALLWSGAPARFDDLLQRFPELAARLAGVARSSRDRGAGPFYQRARAVVRGHVALLGDAAGYLDPISGEGLGLAFREAEALARSVERGGLAEYAVAVGRLRRVPELLTRLLLLAERWPRLRRRFFDALAREPRLFARLLAVHAGAVAPRELGVATALRLTRALVGL